MRERDGKIEGYRKEIERKNGKEEGRNRKSGKEKRGREILRGIKRRGVPRERGGARLKEKKCVGLREREVGNSRRSGDEKEDVGGRR